jgi:diguanylate cyclase (GGDEF)-like protein
MTGRMSAASVAEEPGDAVKRPSPTDQLPARVTAPGRWRRQPTHRIALLSALMIAATIPVQVLLAHLERGSAFGHEVAPVWVLGAMFVVTEGFVVHLRVRRGGHAVSLSEIPLVLGVLGTVPLLLVLARVIGGGIGLAALRRQRGVKLLFNIALIAVQATVVPLAYRLVAGSGVGVGPRAWLGAYAAMIVADVVSVFLVTAAISLHDDPGEWRRLPAAMRGVPLVAVTTSIALVSGLAVYNDVRALVLLTVVSLVAYVGYRGYSRHSQAQAQVEGLYSFTRALDGSPDGRDVNRILLDRVRDQLRAQVAELVVPPLDGRPGTRVRMTGQGEIETELFDAVPADAWWAPAAGGEPVLRRANGRTPPAGAGSAPKDGIAVPVPIGEETTGVLLVANSLPDLPTFGPEELRLFQALANHASVSLAKARLVTMLREEIAEKEHLALHDPLTGLPNRRRFHDVLETALNGPAGVSPTAVMLMDLDRFKEVNDALGHDTGDALLREVGRRLQRRLADRGTVARLGGDEFAVLLPKVSSPSDAISMAEDLARELDHPIPIGHLTLNTRASIGIALAPYHGREAKTLLQRADVAMYAAKEARSGPRVYQPQDDRNTPHRLALIADLRHAILRRDLLVVFQPKLDPRSGMAVGAEALARWHHPEHGFIPPDDFIPLAEHAGLIRPLTLHVLEVALRRCASWRRSGHDLHVAVNLSPSSLLDGTLPDVVTRLLGQAGVPAAALTLEITESSIMADPAGSLATLDRLHRLGVKLAIDDFGIGYSSLGRLRELPIHEVKIDKSFVQRIGIDHRDRAVVSSAVRLGHALDLEVVAEGVEDRATYAHLTREGCNFVQGYFVSQPLPADEFSQWLTGQGSIGSAALFASI